MANDLEIRAALLDARYNLVMAGEALGASKAEEHVARCLRRIDAALSRTEATGGEQAPKAGPDVQALQKAYAYGWHRCAEWANREDLHADKGSPAYLRDMAADLSDLAGGEQAVSKITPAMLRAGTQAVVLGEDEDGELVYLSEEEARKCFSAMLAVPASEQAVSDARAELAEAVVNAARSAMNSSVEIDDDIAILSCHAAALSLRLYEYDLATQSSRKGA